MESLLYTEEEYASAESHRELWYKGLGLNMVLSWRSLPKKVKDSWVMSMFEFQSKDESEEEEYL